MRYWDGTAWTGHTQPKPQPTPQAPQGFDAIGGRLMTPAVGPMMTPGVRHMMTPGFASRASTYAPQEPPVRRGSMRGLWVGLGIAAAVGLVAVAAVVVVILPKFAQLSPDYTGAPVTSSDVVFGPSQDHRTASGLEGVRADATFESSSNSTSATMAIVTVAHGRRFVTTAWVSYQGPIDEESLDAFMATLRVDT